MRKALRELGLRTPLDVYRAARNLALTVWDPTRSDIRHGINQLMFQALREAPEERNRELEAAHPELVELFREGYDPDVSPARLGRLPDGTLGREYARFIHDNEIDALATLLALGTPRNTLEYLFKRAYKLHDIMHVVLGADASVLGEVRIVSYTLGQMQPAGRAPALALAVLFMNIGLRRPHEIVEAIRLSRDWLDLGDRSPWHVTTRVEDWLDRPVEEVRARMLVTPLTGERQPALRVASGSG